MPNFPGQSSNKRSSSRKTGKLGKFYVFFEFAKSTSTTWIAHTTPYQRSPPRRHSPTSQRRAKPLPMFGQSDLWPTVAEEVAEEGLPVAAICARRPCLNLRSKRTARLRWAKVRRERERERERQRQRQRQTETETETDRDSDRDPYSDDSSISRWYSCLAFSAGWTLSLVIRIAIGLPGYQM